MIRQGKKLVQVNNWIHSNRVKVFALSEIKPKDKVAMLSYVLFPVDLSVAAGTKNPKLKARAKGKDNCDKYYLLKLSLDGISRKGSSTQ